jgi:hypothetical protein
MVEAQGLLMLPALWLGLLLVGSFSAAAAGTATLRVAPPVLGVVTAGVVVALLPATASLPGPGVVPS